MPLVNMDNTGGILTALDNNAQAVSVLQTQGVGESDYSGVKNISMNLEFTNISTSTGPSYAIATSAHTSNTAPNTIGTITSTKNLSDNAWKAFDKVTNVGDGYKTLYPVTSTNYAGVHPWIIYSFVTPTKIEYVKMLTDSSYLESPKSFYFDASNDGTNWTRLYTGYEPLWNQFTWKTYNFANTAEYKYYKVSFAEARGGASAVKLREIEYYKQGSPGDANLLKTTTDIASGDALVFVKSDNSITTSTASGVTAVLDTLEHENEAMTAYTGVDVDIITNDAINAFSDHVKAFDKVLDTKYATLDPMGTWLGLHFKTAPVLLTRYSIRARNYYSTAYLSYPIDWTFDASDDGINWVTIDTQAGHIFVSNELKEFTVSINKKYSYYRIFPTLTSNGINTRIQEFRMYWKDVLGYEMDTTAVTSGEAPVKVYKTQDEYLEINGVPASNPQDNFTMGSTLTSTRTYNDVKISGRTVETKIKLSKGNKMTSLTADLWKRA